MSTVMSEPSSTEELAVVLPSTAGVLPSSGEREIVAELVGQAQSDRSRFESLYRLHVDAVYRFCLRRVGSPELAADLTSQIFIKAFTSLHTCDAWRFRSWLFAIARNTLIDELRGHRDHASLDETFELESHEPTPEAAYLEREQRHSVVQLLSMLTPDQRQVVELRLAGLNGTEIADVLGRSRASVDTAQSRAIARLRRVMLRDREGCSEEYDVAG